MRGRVSAELSIHQYFAKDSPLARGTNPLKIKLWTERITAFYASGKTVAVFFQDQLRSVNFFYAWKRRIETVPEIDTVLQAFQKQVQKPSAFLPVLLRSTREQCVSIQIPFKIETEISY